MSYENLLLFFENVWSTTLALAPWLLFGFLIAGLLHVWVPDNFVKHHLGRKRGLLTVLKSVIFGVPMPLCSCGVIPTALGIKKQGAGDGAAIGFLISTPQTGVDSIMVSASMLGWPFAVFKLASAFVIGVVGGAWAHFSNSPSSNETIDDDDSSNARKRGIKDLFEFAVDDLFKMIWRWLVAGIFISAAITTWIPEDFFQTYLPDNIFAAMLVVLVISLPMYVCATASVPIAAALVATGMPTGAALVFLMAGPASNVATIGAVYKAFGMKKLLIYLTSIIVGSMLGGFLFNSVIIPTLSTQKPMEHPEGGWISIISAAVFILLILRFALMELKEAMSGRKVSSEKELKTKTLTVSGMTCKNCAAKLKKALEEIEGVALADIDVESGKVDISGAALNDDSIAESIATAGFSIHP
ncbi:MAG: hypothetical protein GXP32_09325 [Kiritimatiellaeota bacterium]|nr:hypothetical protein [Kiritimatiellota bacterium]